MKKLFFASLKLCVSAVFIYAGFVKILEPNVFYKDILAYGILPEGLSYLAAYILPPFEVVLGMTLLLPKYSKSAAIWLLILLIIFVAALISAYLRGLDINCGCFGNVDMGTYLATISKNILLSLMLLLMLLKK